MKSGEAASTTVNINDEGGADTREKALPAGPAKVAAAAGPFAAMKAMSFARGGWKRGIAVMDFIARLFAISAAIAAAVLMGTTDETLPFFTQFFQFHTSYEDFSALTFFVIATAITSGYLLLSLLFSIISIVRPRLAGLRLLLLVFDMVILTLTTAAAGAATAIVYLAHSGNSSANWAAICIQFNNFCQRSSGAVVSAFVVVVILMLLIVMSALVLRKH